MGVMKRRINIMNEIRITIEGLKELTEAVRALAGIQGGQQTAVSAPPVQSVQPQVAPVTAVGPQSYMQVPAQPAPISAGATMPQPSVPEMGMPGAVPTTAMARTYTIEQLQVAAAGLSSMGKMQQLMGILQQFGIQAMTELPAERYGEFATALREAGAQI